jgi:hypothetical protein
MWIAIILVVVGAIGCVWEGIKDGIKTNKRVDELEKRIKDLENQG